MTAPAAASAPLPIFASTIEEPAGQRIEFSTHRDRAGTPFLTIAKRDGLGRVAIPLPEAVLQELVILFGPDFFDGALLAQ